MRRTLRNSIARKLLLVVLATTFTALAAATVALLIYDARTYRATWIKDLSMQADILARASAPALAFDDEKAALANLRLLQVRNDILGAELHTASGELFGSYRATGTTVVELPMQLQPTSTSLVGTRLAVVTPVLENGQRLGTLYLYGRYDFSNRLNDYLQILAAVMAGSLLLATLVAMWLQRSVTRPVLSLTDATREVIASRDFSKRVARTSEDEIGVLVDAFNAMVSEVGRRTDELATMNRDLQHQMIERRAAEDALRRADRMKDEFLATLAHELRNPLAPLRTGIELMRRAGGDTAKMQTVRGMMERQINQMVRLVDDLLDVSRITTGRLTIDKQPVDLREVLLSAVETARPLIATKDHALEVQLGDQTTPVRGDATRLAQVFSNLLNNAARYTPSGGRISLQATNDTTQIQVDVRDNGVGLTSDSLEDIFGMFMQVDRSLERVNAGLGVGLSLARKLIELHGGTIRAASAGVGLGSQFTVRLPMDSSAKAPVTPTDHVSRVAIPRRILVADDNEDFATSFAMILRQDGHVVEVVHDGNAALLIAARFRPEFAFLDIGLPGLNGYDLAQRLRAHAAGSRLVLSAITGWGQQDDRARARAAGFDHHFVKPVDFQHILILLSQSMAAPATNP